METSSSKQLESREKAALILRAREELIRVASQIAQLEEQVKDNKQLLTRIYTLKLSIETASIKLQTLEEEANRIEANRIPIIITMLLS
ncbi:MAG: hypothetical protein QW491_13105 [Thermoproteota archaeon]|nr:hypothetical protein [Candidatus Brockarchaeota archaeon]